MPNLITHKIFAEEMRASLSGQAKEIVDKNPEAFDLGAIGGDFLYALRELNFKCKRLANKLHAYNIYEVFSESGAFVRQNKNEVMLSYLLGLVCHYSMDSVAHPYVNYFVENVMPRYYVADYQYHLHGLLESGIDECFCRERLDMRGGNYPCGKISKAPLKVRLSIGELYSKVISGLYNEKISPAACALSFFITRMFMIFSMDKSGKKKDFIAKLENALGLGKTLTTLMRPPVGFGVVDFMNTEHLPWRIVRNEDNISTESFNEIYARAKEKCFTYIGDYLAYVNGIRPLDKAAYNINYEGIRTNH